MSAIVVPVARHPIRIRPATMDDLPFIDSLQKLHSKQVGWMPAKQLEGKIAAGQVIVAEESVVSGQSSVATDNGQLPTDKLGYCIGHDQYFKRDDVGIIYQMNVVPAKQRGLIGATLVKAMFDRAAYGCRLFCCWCAQDIEANYFWGSLGFIPLAFRAGSREKDRVHIFWQRRIRAGDVTTPYWFPAQTSAGAIREDRLVLPIPPGHRWSDPMPRVLPRQESAQPQLQAPGSKRIANRKDQLAKGPLPPTRRFVQIGPPSAQQGAPIPAPVPAEKPKKQPVPKQKNDPKLVAAARELRDRWLEQFNSVGPALPVGRYDVAVALPAPGAPPARQIAA